MKAIETRYTGPTDSRGAGVLVKAEGFRATRYAWDHALNEAQNHDAAAVAFAKARGWKGAMAEGGAADGRGHVYVFVYYHGRPRVRVYPYDGA